MRVIVAGGLKKPIMLDTNEATAILIATDDGQPNVIFKLMENRRGWIRLTSGEDKNFNSTAKELGLM
jgi:hypothetical protein